MECKWADSKAESLAVPMDYLQAVSLVVTKVLKRVILKVATTVAHSEIQMESELVTLSVE